MPDRNSSKVSKSRHSNAPHGPLAGPNTGINYLQCARVSDCASCFRGVYSGYTAVSNWRNGCGNKPRITLGETGELTYWREGFGREATVSLVSAFFNPWGTAYPQDLSISLYCSRMSFANSEARGEDPFVKSSR